MSLRRAATRAYDVLPWLSPVPRKSWKIRGHLLERWATRGSRQSVLYTYKREARQRQRAQAGATAPPPTGSPESLLLNIPSAAPPRQQTRIVPPTEVRLTPEPVPSVARRRGPAAKTSDEWAYEHFVGFETLCGNGDRIPERIEEARSYEPEDPPPDYLW